MLKKLAFLSFLLFIMSSSAQAQNKLVVGKGNVFCKNGICCIVSGISSKEKDIENFQQKIIDNDYQKITRGWEDSLNNANEVIQLSFKRSVTILSLKKKMRFAASDVPPCVFKWLGIEG